MKVGDLVKRKFATDASEIRFKQFNSNSAMNTIGIITEIDEEAEMVVVMFNFDGAGVKSVLPLGEKYLELVSENR